MNYPAKDVTIPNRLKNISNGRLPDNMLKTVKCGGRMFLRAADDFDRMYDAALQAGIKLRNVGDYRPYEAQKALFEQRYSLKDDGRKPQITRTLEGQTYYLKKGCSPSSTPGKSNHGYGLAIDLGVDEKGAIGALGSDKKALKWMCENAPSFNFFLQVADPKDPQFEAWHWQWCKPSES